MKLFILAFLPFYFLTIEEILRGGGVQKKIQFQMYVFSHLKVTLCGRLSCSSSPILALDVSRKFLSETDDSTPISFLVARSFSRIKGTCKNEMWGIIRACLECVCIASYSLV